MDDNDKHDYLEVGRRRNDSQESEELFNRRSRPRKLQRRRREELCEEGF